MSEIITGTYKDWTGKEQWCVVKGDRVHCFDAQSFTVADINTFRRWNYEFVRHEHAPSKSKQVEKDQ